VHHEHGRLTLAIAGLLFNVATVAQNIYRVAVLQRKVIIKRSHHTPNAHRDAAGLCDLSSVP